jgi:hypothetical protein
MQEGGVRFSLFPGCQDARVHVRGNYERLGERVPRRFPVVLAGESQPPITAGSGRLELARWIASANNPLTARVMVNRIWQHHFGEGLVQTASNFGRRGTPPTHPELLDYLARRFVASGWSVKAMHRLILLSATYQQSTRADPRSHAADPANRLVSRMNRRPLDAEALRDSLLAVGGSLDTRAGGPADRDANSARRMLYLRSSRSENTGFGALFDAADPAIHVEKRTASTVAPQALFLMNNPMIAKSVSRMLQLPEIAHRQKQENRMQALYQLILGRNASATELAVGRRLLDALSSSAPRAPQSGAPALLGAWETYAQALLLSNEFLFVD